MTSNAMKPQVWPVIHVASPSQSIECARIAHGCGCTGIFLISMRGKDDPLQDIGAGIRSRLPDLKIGINYLTKQCDKALALNIENGFDATWTDASGVRSDIILPKAHAVRALIQTNPGHLFFGGVAFKYQEEDKDPPLAAKFALDYRMIPTTTGEGTGIAAPAQKLAGIRAAIGDAPLAIASGMTPDNVGELGAFLTHILVATGVSKNEHEFDEPLLRLFMERLPETRRAIAGPLYIDPKVLQRDALIDAEAKS